MTDSPSLYDELAAARKGLHESLYPSLAAAVALNWQTRNKHPLVDAVMRGETTFADAFEPLAQANLSVDAVRGTDDRFEVVAQTVGSNLKGVLPLVGFPRNSSGTTSYANLTAPLESQRELTRSAAKMGAVMGAIFALLTFALTIGTGADQGLGTTRILVGIGLGIAAFGLIAASFTMLIRSMSGSRMERRHIFVEDVRRMARELDGILSPSSNNDRVAA